MILYDSSAFFEHILKKDIQTDAFILDLTFYEVGNVIIKHEKKIKTLTKQEAKAVLKILDNWPNFIFVRPYEIEQVYDIASLTDLTFYDAAYLFVSKKYNATLETCDKKLHERGKKVCDIRLLEIPSKT